MQHSNTCAVLVRALTCRTQISCDVHGGPTAFSYFGSRGRAFKVLVSAGGPASSVVAIVTRRRWTGATLRTACALVELGPFGASSLCEFRRDELGVIAEESLQARRRRREGRTRDCFFKRRALISGQRNGRTRGDGPL